MTTISNAAMMALSWIAGVVGTFGDELDRSPEPALIRELRDAKLIRPCMSYYEPTAAGDALLESAKLAPVLVVVRVPGTILGGGKVRVEQRMMRKTSFGTYDDAKSGIGCDAYVHYDGNLWHGAPDWTMIDAWAARPAGATSVEIDA